MVGHGGSSAGSYLASPTSPIPSHCASIVTTSTLRVKISYLSRCNSIHYKWDQFEFTEELTQTLWLHRRGGIKGLFLIPFCPIQPLLFLLPFPVVRFEHGYLDQWYSPEVTQCIVYRRGYTNIMVAEAVQLRQMSYSHFMLFSHPCLLHLKSSHIYINLH